MKAGMQERLLIALLGVMAGMAPAIATPSALELKPCAVEGLEGEFRCGTLEVPEDPSRPDERRIGLNVLVVPALKPQAGRVPLYSLSGGPGMAATEEVYFWATDGGAHRQHRDIVLIDQRGTGKSNPLRCPALENRNLSGSMYPLGAVRACREKLEQGADLAQYGTANAVGDIDAVRRALEHGKIDLTGLSYGTRLAQAYLRKHPAQVRTMVLLGSVPFTTRIPLDHAPGAQAVLDAIFAACDADAPCHAAFPQLRQEWTQVLERLDNGPIETTFTSKEGVSEVNIERGAFGEAFRSHLLTTPGQRKMPYVIHQMAAGNFQPFLASLMPLEGSEIAGGMYLSVMCAEDSLRITPEERTERSAGTFLGTYRVDEQINACREWGATALPDAQFPALTSDVPVLLMAGSMDYVTPDRWASEIARGLPNGRVIVFEGLGHFPIGLDGMECYDRLIADFFEQGSAAALDPGCKAGMKPPPFVLAEPAAGAP